MDKDKVEAILAEGGFEVVDGARLGNNLGWALRLATGQIVNVYDSGKVVVQGKNPDAVRALLAGRDDGVASVSRPKRAEVPRKIFVVYGHKQALRDELEAMLRRWDLEPLILDQLPSGGQTIIEKLESVRAEAGFAVILATPDDEGHRAEHPDEKAFRARQNVVLELGMMLAILGRPNVAILLQTSVQMERPSDIQGLIYISFKDHVAEGALTLAKEINARGIQIDLSRV